MVVCDYLVYTKLDVRSIDVSFGYDVELLAMLETPVAEYFEGADYQGIRVWFTPKPNEDPADLLERIAESAVEVFIIEEDGFESGFVATEFYSDPPYETA